MAAYDIVVDRTSRNLSFSVGGSLRFSTEFWEDPSRLIPAKEYTGCSATIMATKGYKSVYLPDAQTGRTGIFIHQGMRSEHSDGCIVCARSRVEEIYDSVPPDGQNITVKVT